MPSVSSAPPSIEKMLLLYSPANPWELMSLVVVCLALTSAEARRSGWHLARRRTNFSPISTRVSVSRTVEGWVNCTWGNAAGPGRGRSQSRPNWAVAAAISSSGCKLSPVLVANPSLPSLTMRKALICLELASMPLSLLFS